MKDLIINCVILNNIIGWSAAVANMLDTVEKFKFKAEIFETDFKRYLDGREDSIDLLNKYVMILSYNITLFFYNFSITNY